MTSPWDLPSPLHESSPLDSGKETFRALFESAPEAIYLIDPATLCIRAHNRKAAEMDGYSDQEIARMTAPGLYPPEERSLVQKGLKEVLTSSFGSASSTLHQVTKYGQVRSVEETRALIRAGGEQFILTIVRDVAGRQETDEKIKASEEKFRKAFMLGADAFYLATLMEGRLLEVNDRFEDVFGYTR